MHLVATPRLTSRGRGSWGSAGRLTQLHMQHFAAATNCNLDCAGMQHVDVICKLYAVAIVSADFLRNISPPAALLSSRKMRKLGKKAGSQKLSTMEVTVRPMIWENPRKMLF